MQGLNVNLGSLVKVNWRDNIRAVVRDTRRIIRDIETASFKAARNWGRDTNREIKGLLNNVLVQKRTGTMYRSQNYLVQWNPRHVRVSTAFYSTDPVAPIVHEGLRTFLGGVIRPRGRGNAYTDLRGKQHPGANVLKFTLKYTPRPPFGGPKGVMVGVRRKRAKVIFAKSVRRGHWMARKFIERVFDARISRLPGTYLQQELAKIPPSTVGRLVP